MIDARIKRCTEHLYPLLVRFLPKKEQTPSTLYEAMHYACLNGGKRLRPLLVYSTAEMFGATWEQLDPIACAIEFIHCYSLVHDDLPSMDNDDLRRGKPTCHKVFGEATAVLTGDALLTLAFEILATPEFFPHIIPQTQLQLIRLFTQAAGAQGMVRGQALDMAPSSPLNLEELSLMHRTKTGALITVSVQCGALATGHATFDDLDRLQNFGTQIGLAFQIHDDILDSLGNSHTMGKNAGQDVKNNKCTYVTLLGVAGARRQANEHYQSALVNLESFGAKADPLRALSAYIIGREL